MSSMFLVAEADQSRCTSPRYSKTAVYETAEASLSGQASLAEMGKRGASKSFLRRGQASVPKESIYSASLLLSSLFSATPSSSSSRSIRFASETAVPKY